MKTLARLLAACLLSMSASPADGIPIPAGGVELTDGNAPIRGFVDPALGKAEPLEHGGIRLTVESPDATRPFLAQTDTACPKGALGKGDHVLTIVKARSPGGKGSVMTKLQLAKEPYPALAHGSELEITGDWREYPIVCQVTEPAGQGAASMVLFFGHQKQTIELAEIRVIRYAAGFDASKLPRLRRTYEGRAPDAPWRQAALDRIETQRKKNLSLTLTGPGGQPLAHTPVRVRLRRHEFGFGSAVPAALLTADSEDGRRFRDIVDRYFSIVVFENDLKDFCWNSAVPADQKTRHKETLDKAFAWLAGRHIKVRGHYLLQVAEYDTMKTQTTDAIRAMVLDTARERIAFAGDRVCEWDAINHPVAWGGARLLTHRPGMARFDHEVLALARSLSPLPMFVNEDQLFRPGPQADGTFDYLRQLKEQGIRIDGLGNQAHMHESYLPSPDEILATTDRFAELAPRQAITEFDLQTEGDEELAADYTRDLLITCFSHPAYQSFLWWGFWEGSHWLPATASWNKDWSIRQRGKVIEEWLGTRWRTETAATTDAQGVIRWRGFPGHYEAVIGGQTVEFLASSATPAAAASAPAP